MDKTKRDNAVAWSAILGSLFTALSLAWGACSYYSSVQVQRQLAAHAIYQEHLKTSLENPELANPSLQAPAASSVNEESKKKRERYEWYIGHALFSFESILEASSEDEAWKTIITDFMKTHQEYIKSEAFPCTHYGSEIKKLLNQTLGVSCSKSS